MRMLDELNDQASRGDILLNEWEERFVADMAERVEEGKQLTGPQFAKLNEIYDNHIGD